jgi:YidC/Oxa1 family membrane protein insertase
MGFKTYTNEKSISYENRYSELYYEHEEGKSNYLGLGSQEDDVVEDVLCSIQTTLYLVIKYSFEKAELHSTNLVKDDKVDTTYKTNNKAVLPLAFKMEKLTKK